MRFDSIVDLIEVNYNQDEIGNSIEILKKRSTFAKKQSVKQSEYYQAASLGLKPELVFIIWTQEYQGEPKLEFAGKIYAINRTYERPDEKIELHCEARIGG
ncbi:hypothetical protein AF332_07100 [Sporosarcina globispora]|uniref:Phage head-tail adapter protein n=1 Tax=Sporosarcina globispora TaxID=1459 RepID=A0A0M0GAQ6_SPOGL|nr:phage head closure protein [Sporosarcina globispora]KON86607.1 hypothetical protein AF332_07100 [Sporosarcina globispora]